MGESRSELLAWLNELLNLSYTKVEQCGSGYAYAQVIDSVYGNVTMSKLIPNAKQEYEFITNFKVLQAAFARNKINKPIPVERLVKCKMQDNLEFLQWIKKFWDTNYPGTPYDADARRGGAAAAPPPLTGAVSVGAARPMAPSNASASRASTSAAAAASSAAATRRAAGGAAGAGAGARPVVGGTARARGVGGGGAVAVPTEQIQQLTAEMDEMKLSVDTLERERDFYFQKLRDIEVLINDRLSLHESGEPMADDAEHESVVLKQVQAILYSTEEGFELPDGAEAGLQDEEEVF